MSDLRSSLGGFLRARRDSLRPVDVGRPGDPRRRVPGLRRHEVAEMAGISADYYLRLEQGRDHQPSAQVLLALGRALQLDADGTEYLFRLAGQVLPPSPAGERARSGTGALRGGSYEVLDNVATLLSQWTSTPAYVTNRTQDVLAVNPLGRTLIPLSLPPGANMVEAIVDGALAAGTDQQEAWDRAVRNAVSALRYCGSADDPRLQLLVASLSSRSRRFRQVWASHEAHPQRAGVAAVRVEPFGYIDFRWQTFEVPGGEQFLTTFFGEPGSAAAAAIDYLAAKLRLADQLGATASTRTPELP